MFTQIIKSLRQPLGLLLFLVPSFSRAQPDGDSTFNGIDYYAGRIVRGFGGGFQQLVGEKENNQRPFSTAPSLYGSIGNRLGLRLSNSTNWMEFDDIFAQRRGLAKNTIQFTTIQMTTRLASGAWLQGSGVFRREKWEGSLIDQYKNTNEGYGLRWFYLSRGGRIGLTQEQLAYAYYAAPAHSVLQNILEMPLRFLSPKQTMLLFSGEARHSESLLHTTSRLEPDFPEERRSSFRNSGFAYLDLVHAVNRRVMLGFTLQPLREKSQSDESRPDYEYFSSGGSTSWGFSPRIDYFADSQILHRFAGNYGLSQADQTVTSGTVSNLETKGKQWQFDYAFHYLRQVQPLSIEAFLADGNHVFGNRLPTRAWHLIGRASTSFSKRKYVGAQPIGPSYLGPESKSRYSEFSLTGIYGLLDWLEVGGKTDYSKSRYEMTTFSAMTETSTEKSSYWRHAFALSFANYRYESRFKERFGWEQIHEFDRLHGPLLLGGMINGTLAIVYTSSTAFPNDMRVRIWTGEAQIRGGITGNVELSLSGRLFKQSYAEFSEPTQKYFNVFLAWQPWKSIRFRIGKGNLNAMPEAGFLFSDNEAWNFHLMSLF